MSKRIDKCLTLQRNVRNSLLTVTEIDKIRERYERRLNPQTAAKYPTFSSFQHFSRAEREFWFGQFLTDKFGLCKDLTILEIGAGSGDNIYFFRRFGIPTANIFANELLPERAERLKDVLPPENISFGNALDLSADRKFDIVFQSTVFSSILDKNFQKLMAEKMWSLVKPGGGVLWYDFVYSNPSNPDVRGVSWADTKALFPHAAQTRTQRVILAPPIGRRVGRLYNFVNFPWLRTHRVALFTKG